MLEITLVLITGIFFGYSIRKSRYFLKLIDILTYIFMLVLLFSLGLALGNNKTLVSALTGLGLQGFLIAVFTMLGSSVISMIVYKYIFKNAL